jgi:hypothetical protein
MLVAHNLGHEAPSVAPLCFFLKPELNQMALKSLFSLGERDGTRTHDPLIKSRFRAIFHLFDIQRLLKSIL